MVNLPAKSGKKNRTTGKKRPQYSLTRKQEIVPVQLQDEKRTAHTQYRKQNPQKLVARLKGVDSDLFIYEGIQEELLRVLLSELSAHEDH